MSLNLTGLCCGAEPAADHRDRRRPPADAQRRQAPCAHVDVRLNELEESALSSLLMPMLPVHLLGTEERGAGQRATRSRWRPPTGRPRPRASRRVTSSCASRRPARVRVPLHTAAGHLTSWLTRVAGRSAPTLASAWLTCAEHVRRARRTSRTAKRKPQKLTSRARVG